MFGGGELLINGNHKFYQKRIKRSGQAGLESQRGGEEARKSKKPSKSWTTNFIHQKVEESP